MQSVIPAGIARRLRRRFRQSIGERVARSMFRLRGAEAGEVYLHRRRVYILPTGAAMGYAVMLAVLLVASINYTLSLGFALTFLLATVGMLDMYLTFRNLAFLHLEAGRSQPVFAGEQAQFEMHLMNRRNYPRYAIWLGFMPVASTELAPPEQAVDIPARGMQMVQLSATAERRGWLPAPRVRLKTRFPLGLMRAWAYWQPDAKVLVYPRPEQDGPPLPIGGSDTRSEQGPAGQDDFAGIRPYVSGDPLKHLAWRQIARMEAAGSGQLVTKQFEGGVASHVCLDFAALPMNLDLETKLSRMTRWVIEADALALPYEFRLGRTLFPLGSGNEQRQACLRALALFEVGA